MAKVTYEPPGYKNLNAEQSNKASKDGARVPAEQDKSGDKSGNTGTVNPNKAGAN